MTLRMGMLDEAFQSASISIGDMAYVGCLYSRKDVTSTIRAYFNTPSVDVFGNYEIDLDVRLVEWYVKPEILVKRGFGDPQEFDRITYDGETWEVIRLGGGRTFRDAWPDIAIFTRSLGKVD